MSHSSVRENASDRRTKRMSLRNCPTFQTDASHILSDLDQFDVGLIKKNVN